MTSEAQAKIDQRKAMIRTKAGQHSAAVEALKQEGITEGEKAAQQSVISRTEARVAELNQQIIELGGEPV